jgi:hypothetical protein
MHPRLFDRRRSLVFAACFIASVLFARFAAADTLTLAWDPNLEPNMSGYVVYVGTQSATYTRTFDVGNTTSFTLFDAVPGQRYYFAVAAYEPGPLMGPLSAEVSGVSNAYPVIVRPANQTSTVGQSAQLQLSGYDPDGMPVSYTATGLPPGLILTQSTGLISGQGATAGTYNVTVSVSDGVLSTSTAFSWTMNAATNAAPSITQPANQTSTVGQPAQLQLVGSDPEGQPISFSANGLPPGLTLQSATGLISGQGTTAGTYNVVVSVSDGALSTSASFVWTMNSGSVNAPPVITQPANQTSIVGQSVQLQLVGSDPEGKPVSYTVTGLPPGLSVTSTGLISGQGTTAGTYMVTATVSDGALSTQAAFFWTVNAPPAPVITQPANQTSTVGQSVQLQLVGSDPDGKPVSFTATGLPPGLTVTSTGLISGQGTTAGVVMVTASISNGVQVTSTNFFWTMNAAPAPPVNNPPVITQPGTQTSTVGQAVQLQLVGSDPEGKPVTFTATGLPPGLNVTSTGLISGQGTTAGTYNVTASVSDGALSTPTSFVWTMNAPPPVNQPPTIAQPANQTSTVGQSVQLQLVGSDPEGKPVTYSAMGLPPGLVLAPSTGLIAGQGTTAGAYNVTVSVSDGALSTPTSFVWTMNAPPPVNQAPTIAQPANQTSTVGQPVQLQLVGSDPEGKPVTYTATGLPPGLTLTSSTGLLAGQGTTAGTYNVTVSVSDGALSTSTSFVWTMNAAAPPQPPPSSVVLSARGYKVKGVQTVNLSWKSGWTSVIVYRNGKPVANTMNTGAFTDTIGTKGAGTYTYRVCNPASSECSTDASVTF